MQFFANFSRRLINEDLNYTYNFKTESFFAEIKLFAWYLSEKSQITIFSIIFANPIKNRRFIKVMGIFAKCLLQIFTQKQSCTCDAWIRSFLPSIFASFIYSSENSWDFFITIDVFILRLDDIYNENKLANLCHRWNSAN